VTGQLSAGSGLPETPIYLAAVPGAGYTGTIRPDRTGAAIYAAGGAVHLNSAAFAPPAAGQWGTAGRDSITGARSVQPDSSLARTFRPGEKFFLDARIDATNVLNHAEFTSWNTTVNSTQFELPIAPNAMRSLQTTVRLRF
jgi:trimeric autotransporter adhesin